MTSDAYIHVRVFGKSIEYTYFTPRMGPILPSKVQTAATLGEVRDFQMAHGHIPVYVDAIAHVQEVEEAAHAYGWKVATPPNPPPCPPPVPVIRESSPVRGFLAVEHVRDLIAAVKANYPEDIFPRETGSPECKAAYMARHVCDVITADLGKLAA